MDELTFYLQRIQNLQSSIDKFKDILEEQKQFDNTINLWDKIPSTKYEWSLLTDKEIRELF